MARIRNIVMEGATGRLGGMVLTQRAGTGTVARTLAPEVTNPKSDAQQTRRVKWANLVNFYKVSKGWMAKAFENKASNQSDYNKFMSLNANTTKVSLTKDEASQGGVIAGPYTISQGSLPSVELTRLEGDVYATSLALGSLTIGEGTTVADFSAAILEANNQLREGMQLSFISYQQMSNAVTGVPYCVCGWYEVTLRKNDTTLLNSHLPISFAAATVQNGGKYLGTGSALSSGAFAYVVSDRQGGKILVSTQQLQVHNNEAYNQAITDSALQAAIESYGKNTEVFLAPGYAGGSQAQTGVNSIASIVYNGEVYLPGSYFGKQVKDIHDNPSTLVVNFYSSFPSGTTMTTVSIGTATPASGTATVNGNKITISNFTSTSVSTSLIKLLNFVMSDGKTYTIEFRETPGTVVD